MKKIYKRVLALLLVCVIVSSTTYKAHAAAAVPVVVSAGEAIAYVLGILGITAGAGYVIDKKDEIASWGSDQIVKLKEWTKTNSDKVNVWGAATSQEIESSIDAWFEKLRTGTLDTASAVWDSMKAWGGSIYGSLHGSSDVYIGGAVSVVPHKTSTGAYSLGFTDIKGNDCTFQYSRYNSLNLCGAFYHRKTATYDKFYLISLPSVSGSTNNADGNFLRGGSLSDVTGVGRISTLAFDVSPSITDSLSYPIYEVESYPFIDAAARQILTMSIPIPADEYITVGGVSDIFDRDKSLDNIGVAVPGIAAGATDIPIDWGLVGDIAGTLTDVRAGIKDIADTLADAKVFPIDTTRDTVIDSDGDLSNDKAKDDVIPAVPNVGTLDDYKLAGLEKVFPFCIPFDLIAFLGCLSAAPEAPAFDWVFPLPGKDGKEYTLHVDLSPWEPVAKIARTMETLAFCIGLVMITREKMIVS